MTRRLLAVATLLAAGAAAPAFANCPPLSVYRVTGVTLTNGTLAQATQTLFAGTAWKAEPSPAASNLNVSLSDVGGPLDKVLAAVLQKAGGSTYAVGSTIDAASCVVHINATSLAPPVVPAAHASIVAPPVPDKAMPPDAAHSYALGSATPVASPAPAAPAYTLKAHMLLSRALAEYVKHEGWTLKWNVADDYMLDAPFPIPAGDNVISGVSYVIDAYKEQGGLLGATALFAKPNHVVAIIPTTAAAQENP